MIRASKPAKTPSQAEKKPVNKAVAVASKASPKPLVKGKP